MDLGRFNRLLLGHVRHDRGNPLGQHRLASARRTDHQQIVVSGGGDFQRPFDVVLAFDFVEVHLVRAMGVEKRAAIEVEGRDEQLAVEKVPGVPEIADRIDLDPLDHGGFRRVFIRYQQPVAAPAFRFERDRKHALDRPHRAIQAEFPDHAAILHGHLLGATRRDHRQGDGQVKRRPFLLQIRRREVDDFDAIIEVERGGPDGGGDALGRFPDRRVRQAHDDNDRFVSAMGVDLDLDFLRFHAAQCC